MNRKDIPQEWVDVGCMARHKVDDGPWADATTRAIIAAVYPRIEAKVREECARLAETFPAAGEVTPEGFVAGPNTPYAIAALIRKGPSHD